MDNQISGDTQAAPVVDTPATGQTTDAAGTPQANGQPGGQSGHVEDIFQGVDPAKLPPELRPHLDSMVRKYREKTEKLSETVKSEVTKATEAYKKKAEFYDQLAAEKEFVDQWNAHVQKRQTVQNQNVDPTQKELAEIKERQAALELKAAAAENLDAINGFANAKDEKGTLLHPEFDDLSSIMVATHPETGKEISLIQLAILTAPGNTVQERLDAGYKKAKASYDAIFEKGKKAGMGRLQDKVRGSSMEPSSMHNVTGQASRAPKNALEALQFAKQGLAPYKK